MWKEFKAFITRGSIVDMAVGIAVGSAFTAVVKSLVDNVLMPPLGLLLGNVGFTNMFVVLKQGATAGPYATLEAATAAGAQTWRYGLFLNSIVTFVIVAFAFFLILRAITRASAPKEAPAPTTKQCPYCKSEIAIDATRCPHCTSQLG